MKSPGGSPLGGFQRRESPCGGPLKGFPGGCRLDRFPWRGPLRGVLWSGSLVGVH
jgi:hypothetical protein